MAYCAECGSELVETAAFCHQCGAPAQRRLSVSTDEHETPASKPASVAGNGFATAGLVLGIASVFLSFIGIIPILGVVLSTCGLAASTRRGGKGLSQSLVGLALSVLFTMSYLFQYGHLR